MSSEVDERSDAETTGVESGGTGIDGATEEEETSRKVLRRKKNRRGVLIFLRDLAIIIVVAIVASFLLKTFVVRSFWIPSGSMENTLQINDRILVDELVPKFTGYHRGDVVVFRDPGGWLDGEQVPTSNNPISDAIDGFFTFIGLSAGDSNDHLIKRVIGLPGDHVVCCNAQGQITINGAAIDEPYVRLLQSGQPASGVSFDITVPANSLWVLGDNRYESKDSRFNQDQPGKGFVPISDVVGRAFLIIWPLNRIGPIDTYNKVFENVPAPSSSP